MNDVNNTGNNVKTVSKRYVGLKPYKKGQSGNPKGKPKVRQFTKLQRQKKSRKQIEDE